MGNRPAKITINKIAQMVEETGEWAEVTEMLPVGLNVSAWDYTYAAVFGTNENFPSVTVTAMREVCFTPTGGISGLRDSNGKIGTVRVFIVPNK